MAEEGQLQLTPMMVQYRRIKSEIPRDALLLFRLGDFYEMFFDDAVTGAKLLNVALTKRGTMPMCGIPYHAAQSYMARILKAGHKVAICDQMEDPKPGQIVKREVTQILSPGTHLDDRMLKAECNNFLASICCIKGNYGLAIVDMTTGEFMTTEIAGAAALLTELERLRPAEAIVPSEAKELLGMVQASCKIANGYEDWVFTPETAVFTVRDHFQVATLDGFGLRDKLAAIGAVGAVLHYLTQHLRRQVNHLKRLAFYQSSGFLILDMVSLRNLEILEPLHSTAQSPSTLYAALNRTTTPMGARRLREWLSQPLASMEAIQRRQDAVQTWLDHSNLLEGFRHQLAEVRDIERTITRLSASSGNARDLLALRLGLQQIPSLRETLSLLNTPVPPAPGTTEQKEIFQETAPVCEPSKKDSPALLSELAGQLIEMPDLVDHIARAILDEPGLALKDGGLIRDGYDPALDELRRATREGKDWIAKMQQTEIEQTGIPSLKIRFNSVFGYYIEVTKVHLDKVPAHYVRKQTIANGERYITPALKEMESKILGAEERSVKLEYDLFLKVRDAALARLPDIQQTARALAQLDVLGAFAETARLHNYCRPVVSDEGKLSIHDGRHPVLDQLQSESRFVPNDTELDVKTQSIALITGPNMAGKSTYIRQVALLALLAHTGSFIPAREARVDLIDRIFTRIGASDDLSRGQSTFMVEMTETANILNNATSKSLVILDEIGRGTSTFDGLSLAWSIVEYLHNQTGAMTLFATHYHELTELSVRLNKLRNFNVAVREWNDQIIFLRKIIPGGADKSYGIQVARLAGVPGAVLDRAKIILRNLEESELTPEGSVRSSSRQRAEREKLRNLPPPPQLELF